MFYASYGSFMHKLLEGFYKGKLSREEMCTKFLFDFQKEVLGERPPGNIPQKYVRLGTQYLRNFKPFPYTPIAIEKKMTFEIEGHRFVGYIDYLGEKDGKLVIVDNKSRDLKPRSKRPKPTQKDIELDEMLRQLYIYSAAVKQKYGKFPELLCFNCFKANTFIEEKFDKAKYDEAINWAVENIEKILDAEDFPPYIEYFQCKYICGVREDCEYQKLAGK